MIIVIISFSYLVWNFGKLIEIHNIDSYVTMSSDLYGTCRHCFYGTRFGYCSKGTKSSSDNIVPIFIRHII